MKNLDSKKLIALANSIAFKLAEENDNDEILILSDLFVLLGSTLLVIHDKADIAASAKDDASKKNQ